MAAMSLLCTGTKANAHEPNVRVAFTTDVHGSFFPTNYITLQPAQGTLSRVATAVDSLRSLAGPDRFLLLDNGDILQGQPSAYYYNYIDTVSPHLVSEIYNFLGYDATTIGNHDVETGHAVYDRWRSQNKMPMLGANVIDIATGKPYLEPYAVFERGGLKIAVLGLLTPAIPSWLPEVLWSGLRFDDMTATAQKWIPIIKKKEKPDVILGLFHSGHDETVTTGDVVENASVKVAREVPGFDAVLLGHDHQRLLDSVVNVEGKRVFLLNPANSARSLGLLEITAEKGGITLRPKLVDVRSIEVSEPFMQRFDKQNKDVAAFVNRTIGHSDATLSSNESFFGPSAFMSLLHELQLKISGADISFAAPLSFDAQIKKGDVKVSDMFALYKYENMLYVLELTGEEIKNYLEEAYDQWIQTIDDKQKHLIRFASPNPTPSDNRLGRPSYNFDSAAGIDYIVDVTKPKGERVTITRMSDGRKFDRSAKYSVAVNSYRANGGGNLLTAGAKIPANELKRRVLRATDKDLRFYLIKEIEANPEIKGTVMHNWKFVPESVVKPAIDMDRELLFSPESSKEQK